MLDEFGDHQGVFVVSSDLVSEYIKCYNPVVFKSTRTTQVELCKGHNVYNFGESKGSGFTRTLILPTEKHRNFLSGKGGVFDRDKTEKAKNTFYVTITRAKYSVAFIYDGNTCDSMNIDVWRPSYSFLLTSLS